MHELAGKVVTPEEVAGFYKLLPGYWFLLQVLESDKRGNAQAMRVLRYEKNKDDLREHLFEEYIDPDSQYIFVYADPEGKCELE